MHAIEQCDYAIRYDARGAHVKAHVKAMVPSQNPTLPAP